MGATKKLPATIAICFALVAITSAQTQAAPSAATNPNPELVSQLTNQLGVTPEQATGGAGAIFGLVKGKVSPQDFSKIASAVPGMDGFLKAAPASGSGAAQGSSQGVSSALGSAGSMVPGGAGGAGGLASLAGSFQSLGLSPSMASKFAPILQNYVGAKGGSGAASLFGSALK